VRARPSRDPPTSIAPRPLSKPFGSASAKKSKRSKDVSAAAPSSHGCHNSPIHSLASRPENRWTFQIWRFDRVVTVGQRIASGVYPSSDPCPFRGTYALNQLIDASTIASSVPGSSKDASLRARHRGVFRIAANAAVAIKIENVMVQPSDNQQRRRLDVSKSLSGEVGRPPRETTALTGPGSSAAATSAAAAPVLAPNRPIGSRWT